MNPENHDSVQMRVALTAIANEMQRLQNGSTNSGLDDADDGNIFQDLLNSKIALKTMKDENQKLKAQLKTACCIAKLLSSAKEKESVLLNNQLNFTKTQFFDIVKQHNEETAFLKSMTSENQTFRDNLQHFTRSVDLGYTQLQKVKNEEVKCVSTLTKLKEIILSCGQFYADYRNERNKCLKLEQRNRFLCNKLRILECNQGIPHNLTVFRKRKEPSPTEEEKPNLWPKSLESVNIGVVCSNYQVSKSKSSNFTMTKIEMRKPSEMSLKSHLNIVKKLLQDQDSLLKDLKYLSNEIIKENME